MPRVDAHIRKVEQELGSDWFTIHTDDDVVKKLSTKRADLGREAAAFKEAGALVSIEYTENVKRLDDGRSFTNRYYGGGVELGERGNGAGAIPGVDTVQPQARPEDPDRNWRICLQTGAKLAVATMPLMPVDERDFETQKRQARAWAEFFLFEPRPTGASSPDELDDIPY